MAAPRRASQNLRVAIPNSPAPAEFAVPAPGPRLSRGFAALRLAALLVPLLALLGAGWASWRSVEAEAASRVGRTAGLLRENALRAFAAQDATFAAVSRAMAGRDPDALRNDSAFHALLQDLAAAGAPATSGVVVTDGAWRIVSASWEFPARATDLSDRDYIRMLAGQDAPRALGEAVASRPMGWPIIPLARRAPPPPDPLARPGVIVASFNPEALVAFYASVAEHPGDVVALFRADGEVLARHPPLAQPEDPALRERVAAMLQRIRAAGGAPSWVDSALDGQRRLFVVHQVGEWPALVAYGMHRDALVAEWWQRMLAPGLGALSAMALLLTLTLMTERSARLQRDQAESRAAAEAQLARAGRAASLGLLAAGLAHDVKNLVQAVRSGARVMERTADAPDEVRRCARLLADAAERGGRLVEAMLAFARGAAAPENPTPQLDVGATLAELAELLARTLGAGRRVKTRIAPGLPPAHGDRAGFEAAVVNLAANARDAMPGGGVVTISAEEATIADGPAPPGLKPGRYVVTAVRDSGIGMDAATLARLGEPFFTTKPPGIGTGLGLATVRGFCARAGGALRVESTPGRGTTAAIWLPVA